MIFQQNLLRKHLRRRPLRRIKKTKNLKSTRLFSPKKVALPFRVKPDQTVSNEKFVRNQIRISDLPTNFRDSSENRTFHVTVNASKSFEL